jgi:hypothetical protein
VARRIWIHSCQLVKSWVRDAVILATIPLKPQRHLDICDSEKGEAT